MHEKDFPIDYSQCIFWHSVVSHCTDVQCRNGLSLAPFVVSCIVFLYDFIEL